MSNYKKLFYESQAVVADTIEKLEFIINELKRHMQDCEEEVISEENKIININKQES